MGGKKASERIFGWFSIYKNREEIGVRPPRCQKIERREDALRLEAVGLTLSFSLFCLSVSLSPCLSLYVCVSSST